MSSLHLSQLGKWVMESPPIEWTMQQIKELLIGALRQGQIPQHVAFVMDGNRRFARNNKIETIEGHSLGFVSLAKILEICYKSGVKVVTVYAFSIENYKRSKYEVDALMEMAKIKLQQLSQHGQLLERYGACIRVLGRRDLIRPDVLEAVHKAVDITKNNGNCFLNICFPYTSREEITSAIRTTVEDYSKPLSTHARPFSESSITQKLRSSNLNASPLRETSPTPSNTSDIDDSVSSTTTLHTNSPNAGGEASVYPDPENITAETIERNLLTASDPPLDLLVRTSGVKRLSDFMLWQCHEGTEIVFLDCLWPEFDLYQFLPVLIEWQWKQKYEEDKDPAGDLKKTKIKLR